MGLCRLDQSHLLLWPVLTLKISNTAWVYKMAIIEPNVSIHTMALVYTEYAGCAITTGIPVKFGTAHGRSRPEVGSTKCIDFYGSRGVSRPSLISGISDHKNTTPTIFLRPKLNFVSLTVRSLKQYLQNGSENNILLSYDSSAEMYYQFPIAVTAARSKSGKPVCAV